VSAKIFSLCFSVLLCGSLREGIAADQPQWGEVWSRNMISREKGLPESFDPKTGENIRWSAKLGTQTFSTPIVAGGRVYIGTNNEEPRDPKHQGDRGVMMCFEEKTGKFLWQLVVPKREDDPFCDWPKTGMSSPVTVEGDRVYLVNNRGEVMCLDARGMANGNDGPFKEEAAHFTPRGTNAPPQPEQVSATDADILWMFNLTTDAGIWSHDAAHSSILIDGDYLYLNSGTGVDNTHRVIRTPNAPSLVVLDKRTGIYLARDDEHIAPNIFHCTWSSPSMGKVSGRKTIFFAGGNGMIYAFEPLKKNFPSPFILSPSDGERKKVRGSVPATLKKNWQFEFDPTAPKTNVHQYSTNRRESPSNIYGMPVFHRDRIFVAGGGDIFWGKREAWLKCIDATKTDDITSNSLIWSYPLEKHVLGTPAIYNGCVFIADVGRKMHCVDAETGKSFWTHDISGEVWASPLVADGKVYLGARNGDFWIFEASKEKKVIGKIELTTPINATATAANKTLFIATMQRLFAVGK
jgi:outer membrane protein assembly factor BamB